MSYSKGTSIALTNRTGNLSPNAVFYGILDTYNNNILIYTNTTGTWSQVTTITAPTSETFRSLSISNSGTFVVGTTNQSLSKVYIYKNTSGNWSGSILTSGTLAQGFGFSNVISSDASVIASIAYNGSSETGISYVYRLVNGTYTQTQTLTVYYPVGDNYNNKYFCLSSDGSHIGIVNRSTSSNTGSITIYNWNGSSYVQKGSVINGPGGIDKYFGTYGMSITSDGSKFIATDNSTPQGTQGNSTKNVYIYTWDGTSWVGTTLSAYAYRPYPRPYIVHLNGNGNFMYITDDSYQSNGADVGAVYVYYWNGTSWTNTNKFPGYYYSGQSTRLSFGGIYSDDGKLIFINIYDSNAGGTKAYQYLRNSVAPLSPLNVTAVASDSQASVSFSAPIDDGGSAITSYTVTSSPGGFTATGAISPLVVTGLTNGTAYTFTVKATNAIGSSSDSTASSSVTPTGPPQAPTGVVALEGNTEAIVSFTAPINSGGLSIIDYTVTSSPEGLTAVGASSPLTVTGLTNGTSYTFTVVARNELGTGTSSSASSAITVGAPKPPTNVVGTFGNGEVSISFTASDDNGTAVDLYTVTSTPGGFTATGTSSPIIVSGLTNGTSYVFDIVAQNSIGSSSAATSAAVIPATVPAPPTNISATPGVNSAIVSFTGTPFENSGGDAVSLYTVTSSPDGITATGASSPITVTGLTNLTEYTFTIKATNKAGEGTSSTASNSVVPADLPSPPTELSYVPGNNQVTISFTPGNNGGVDITNYQYSTNNGSSYTAFSPATGVVSSVTITGLTNGTKYNIKLKAVNSIGTSSESDPIEAIPSTTPGVPTAVSAVTGDASAIVSFTAPADNGGNAITSYTVTSEPGGFTGTGASSPITVVGLSNGTSYTFTVTATNDRGTGSASSASASILVGLPAAPTAVVGETAQDGTASVSFTAPADNGSAITSYTVTSTPGGFTGTGASSPIIVSGLTGGVSYTFTVTATNAIGTGPVSAASSAMIPTPAWIQMGSDIDGVAANDQLGYTTYDPKWVSVSADGKVVAIGESGKDTVTGVPDNRGAVRIFAWNGSAWQQRGSTIFGTKVGEQCGITVSLSSDGSVVALGSDRYSQNSNNYTEGQIRVFSWNGSSWIQRGASFTFSVLPYVGLLLGEVMKLSSDGLSLALALPRATTPYVAIYYWNGSTWVQRGSNINITVSSVDISSDGTMVAVGNSAGIFSVYVWNGSSWTQRGSNITGETAGDQFGYSVSISSDGMVVAGGAILNTGVNGSQSGSVRVFSWNGSAWVQRGTDIDGEATNDRFGANVRLSSNGAKIAIGAYQNDGNGSNSGSVRLYVWNGTSWIKLAQDIDGEATMDFSGHSLSLSSDGNIVAIGAPGNDRNGTDSGHARVYAYTTVPDAPTNVVAVTTDSQADVSFIEPAYDGNTAITSYTVISTPGGFTATGASSPITVTGLTNGTTYTFTVTATNARGTGIASASSAARTVGAPSRVTNVVGEFGNGQATISFDAPLYDYGSAITSYTVTSSPGNFTQTGSASPLIVTGLTNGTSYTFTVTATNGFGTSVASDPSAAVVPATVPGAPTAVSASGANASATVSFTAPVNNGGSAVTSYTVTSSPGGFTGTGAASPVTVTGLTNGIAYTFTVTATNKAGTSVASSASASYTPMPDWKKVGADIDGLAVNDGFSVVSSSSDGTVIAIGTYLGSVNIGYVRVFGWNGSSWVQRGLNLTNNGSGDYFGTAISLSSDGSVLAVGAPYSDPSGRTNAGQVYVYTWNGTIWTQRGTSIIGLANDIKGYSLSLSSDGTILAIGAPYADTTGKTDAGSVGIFVWNGTSWVQRGTDIFGELASDYSGYENSVSLSSDGSIVAIGAYANDGNGSSSGHVRVYSWNGSSWVQRGSDIDGEAASDQSGMSVSMSSDGSIVAIGANLNDGNGSNSGHVRVYSWNGSSWTQRGTDINGKATNNSFGQAVSLSSSGNVLAVGGPANTNASGSMAGHVMVFSWNGSTWVQRGSDIIGEAANDRFGTYVALSADSKTVVVGAPLNDGNGSNSGSVRVYTFPTTPNAPTGVSAVAGERQVTVSFTAPTDDGGSGILNYTVTSNPEGIQVTGASSPITVTNLLTNVPYTFTVTANNAVGSSTAAVTSAVTPTGYIPTMGLAWIKMNPWSSQSADNVPVIVNDATGNAYCAYYCYGSASGGVNSGADDIVVFKIDTNGNQIWLKQFTAINTNNWDQFPMIAVDSNGNLYVTYMTQGTILNGQSSGNYDVAVAKVDTNGNLLWAKQMRQFNTSGEDYRPSIGVDSSGNSVIAYRVNNATVSGGTFMGGGSYDIVVFKLDTNGNLVWVKQQNVFNTTGDERQPVVGIDSSGNAYIAYDSSGTVSGGIGGSGATLMKMNAAGNIVWIRKQQVMTAGGDNVYSIAVDANGNSHVVYTTTGTVSGGTQSGSNSVVFFKMDTNGNMMWIKQLASVNIANSYNSLPRIATDINSNVYLTFYTNMSGGQSDIVAYKFDRLGNVLTAYRDSIISTSIGDTHTSISADAAGNMYVAYNTNGGVISGGSTGTGWWDVVIFKLTPGPNAPTDVTATINNQTATLTCTAPSDDGGADIIEYIASSSPSGFSIKNPSSPIDVPNLIYGVPYTFTVRAVNANGVVGSDSIPSNTVTALGPPENVTIGYSPNSGLRVSWRGGPITYKVYRDSNSSGSTKVLLGSTTNAYFDDNFYTVGTQYYYFVSLIVDDTEYVSSAVTITPLVTLDWVKQEKIYQVTNHYYNSKNASITCDSEYFYFAYQSGGPVQGGIHSGSDDIVVAKLDMNGTNIWLKQIPVTNTTNTDELPSLAVDSNGNVYVAYQTISTISGGTLMGKKDIVVFKLNFNGDVVWTKQTPLLNTIEDDYTPDLKVDSNGNIYILYMTDGTVSGGSIYGYTQRFVITKMDTDGNIIWLKQERVLNSTYILGNIPSICVESNGTIYGTYYTNTAVSGGTSIGGWDVVVFKIDANGNMIWIKQQAVTNTTGSEFHPVISVDTSGNVYIATYSNGTVSGGTNMGGNDVYVFKMDSNGNNVWVRQTPTMNSAGGEQYPTISTDPNGDVYVAYNSSGTVSGGTNLRNSAAVIMKINTNGNIDWVLEQARTQPSEGYGTINNDITIAANAYGSVYMIYSTTGLVSGGTIATSVGNIYNLVISKYNGPVIAPVQQTPSVFLATVSKYNALYVDLKWNYKYSADSVNIYRDTQISGATKQLIGTSSSYSFMDTSLLTDRTTYYYFVSGVYNGVETAVSAAIPFYYLLPYVMLSWTKQIHTLNTNSSESNPSMVSDADGNVYIVYSTPGTVSGGTNCGSNDIVVAKMDTHGNVIWTRQTLTMNTNNYDSIPEITIDSTNTNIYVTYLTNGVVSSGTSAGSNDTVVFKMTTDGQLVWIKQYTHANSTNVENKPSITVDTSGNVYIAQETSGVVSGGTNLGAPDISIYKLDNNGSLVWVKQYKNMNSVNYEWTPTIIADSSGNIYVAYQTWGGTVSGGTSVGAYTIVLVKLDTNGNIVWIKQDGSITTKSIDYYPRLAIDSNNNLYLTFQGYGSSSGGRNIGNFDIVVIKMDNNGNVAWINQSANLNTPAGEGDPRICVDRGGNVYIAFHTSSNINEGINTGGEDIVVVKLNTNGAVEWTKQEGIVNTGSNEYPYGIAIDSLGNVYVSYQTNGTVSGGSSGGQDIVVLKYTTIAPNPPNTVTATAGNAQATITFTSPTTDNPITLYTVTSIPYGVQASGESLPLTVTGLINGVSYTFIGTVTTIMGTSVASEPSNAIRPIGPPTNVVVGISPISGLRITWLAGPITYKVYRDVRASGATMRLLGTSTTGFYDDTTYIPGAQYYYFVTLNIDGIDYVSSPATYTPTINLDWVKQDAIYQPTTNVAISNPAMVSDADFAYTTYTTTGTVSGGALLGSTDIVVAKTQLTTGANIWIRQYSAMNSTGAEEYPQIAVDLSGNVYVAYQTGGTISGGTFLTGGSGTLRDIVLVKLNPAGNVLWTRETSLMNTIQPDQYPRLAVDANGNIYVSYFTTGTVSGGTNQGGNNIVVFKMNTNGAMVWTREATLMNTNVEDTYPSVAVDSSGNVHVAYMTTGTVSGGTQTGSSDIVIFKMDTNGAVIWIKQQSPPNPTSSVVDSYPVIAVDSTGNVFVTYQTAGTVSGGTFMGGAYDIVLFKLDSSGNLVWIKQTPTMNTSASEETPSLTTDSSGNVYVVYSTGGTISGGTKITSGALTYLFSKFDTDGNMEWILQQSRVQPTTNGTLGLGLNVSANSVGSIVIAYNTSVGTVSGGTNRTGTTNLVLAKYSTRALPPQPPSLVSAAFSTYNNANVELSWIYKNGADSVRIYKDIQASGATKTLIGTSSGYTFTDTTEFKDKFTYYYFLSGVFNDVESSLTSGLAFYYVAPRISFSWIKQMSMMNTTLDDIIPKIAIDSSGNAYIAFQTSGTVSGGTLTRSGDIVVYKLDISGNIEWIKQQSIMNTTQGDDTPNIAVDTNGNVYVAYRTNGTVSGGVATGNGDIVVFKMDTLGNMVWIKQERVMNTTSSDQRQTIAVDSNGNVYLAYNTTGTVSGGVFMGGATDGDIVVVKMDTNGRVVWIRQRPAMNTTSNDYYPYVSVDAAGNVYVSYQTIGTVSSGTNKGGFESVVFKMDTLGNVLWVKQQPNMNTTMDEQQSKIKVDAAGNVYVTYNTNSGTVSGGTFLGGTYDIVVYKLNTSGTLEWIKQQSIMNTIASDIDPQIDIDALGNVYVVYTTSGTVSGGLSSGGTDIVFFKLDNNGNMLWIKQEPIANTITNDSVPAIAADALGNLYLSYQTVGTVSGGTFLGGTGDIVVAKYAAIPEVYVPDPPTNVTATALAAGNSALVSWKAPLYNGNAIITQYTVISSPGNIRVTSPTTSATVPGLINGDSYTFTVYATNYVGDSIISDPSSAIISAAVPSAPNNLSVTTGDNQASLSWTMPDSTGGVALSGYRITINPGNIVVNVSSGTYSRTITGLYDNVNYSVLVQGVNSTGAGTAISDSFRLSNNGAVSAVQSAKINATSFQTYIQEKTTKTLLQTYLELRNTIKEQNLEVQDERPVRQNFINTIRNQNANTILTVPQADASILTNSMKTVNSVPLDKDVQVVLPVYDEAGVGSINVNDLTTDGSKFTNFEIPPNNSLVLTDGTNSITLTYDGTTVSDGSRTYVNGDVLRLGTTYYKLLGIGSLFFDVFPERYQLVIGQGCMQIQMQGVNKVFVFQMQRGF